MILCKICFEQIPLQCDLWLGSSLRFDQVLAVVRLDIKLEMLEINKIKFRFGWAKEMFEFQTKFDIIPNLSYLQISKNWKNESFF